MNDGDYGDRRWNVGGVVEISVICCVYISVICGVSVSVVLGSCYVGCICDVGIVVSMSDSEFLTNSQVLYIHPLNAHPQTTHLAPQTSINLPHPHLPLNHPNINIHFPNIPISLGYFSLYTQKTSLIYTGKIIYFNIFYHYL